MRVARTELGAHRRIVAEESGGKKQQILEAQLARRVSLALERGHGALEKVNDDRIAVLAPPSDYRGDIIRHEVAPLLSEGLGNGFTLLVGAPSLLRDLAMRVGDALQARTEATDIIPVIERAMEFECAHKRHERIPAAVRLRRRHGGSRPREQRAEPGETRANVGEWNIRGRKRDVCVAHHYPESVEKHSHIDADAAQRGETGIIVALRTLGPAPPEVALQLAPVLFAHLGEPRIEPRLERLLAKEPPAKGVDRSEESARAVSQRAVVATSLLVVRGLRAGAPLELDLKSLAQLIGGLTCEGHRRDTLHRRSSRDQRGHAIHQRRSFPRARTGLDEHVRVEIAHDLLARELVATEACLERLELFAHLTPLARRASIARYCSSVSACSCAHRTRNGIPFS